MRRISIVVSDDLVERLHQEAKERGVSLAQVVREALEEKGRQYRSKPRSLGIGASGRTDIARRTTEEPAIPEPWR